MEVLFVKKKVSKRSVPFSYRSAAAESDITKWLEKDG
jgi:hypothetical protein